MKTVLFLDIDGVLAPKQIFDPYALEPDLKYRLAQEKTIRPSKSFRIRLSTRCIIISIRKAAR